MSNPDRPLLHARRGPGRPRKHFEVPPAKDSGLRSLSTVIVAQIPPRLLDLEATAAYLGISLRVNMDETLTPRQINVEGEIGLEDEWVQWNSSFGPCSP